MEFTIIDVQDCNIVSALLRTYANSGNRVLSAPSLGPGNEFISDQSSETLGTLCK